MRPDGSSQQPETPLPVQLSEHPVRVGRRVFLGMVGLGAAGVAFGSQVQTLGSKLLSFLPWGNYFRFYTITGSFPAIPRDEYRLQVTGLVDRPLNLSLNDIEAMPSTKLVKNFQCVTGWQVPHVHWQGVRLSDVLDAAGVQPSARAVAFDSYDGADTESLTLYQAHLPDAIVAYRMLGAPITTEHGGPVRLYVAPMYGYKSLKWLRSIRLVEQAEPGYWEQNGYPVDAWIGGTEESGNQAAD
jgi:DMSO/TMAO reductase YedYZ molybdopterin-dependent catalytic subunit